MWRTPAAIASRMNVVCSGVYLSRFVPRPMRGTSVPARRSVRVLSVVMHQVVPRPDASSERARPGLRAAVVLDPVDELRQAAEGLGLVAVARELDDEAVLVDVHLDAV